LTGINTTGSHTE